MVYRTYKNKVQYLSEWAEEYKIPYQTFRYRIIEANWPMKKALTTPPKGIGCGSKPRMVKYKGKTKSVAELAKEYGLSPYNIKARLDAGWTVHKTLTVPVRDNVNKIKYKRKTRSVREWSDLYDIPYKILAKRLWLNWTIHEALTIPIRKHKNRR